jgi:hypothetical protein
LAIKDIITLLDLFKNDLEFKRFLGYNLKEKIIKTTNLPLKELMSSVLETLDLEGLRGEVVRYALNSEVFYAFPVSYLISLLRKLVLIGPAEDLRDLIKTIQISLCLKQSELSLLTMKKLIQIHSYLPVLNS